MSQEEKRERGALIAFERVSLLYFTYPLPRNFESERERSPNRLS